MNILESLLIGIASGVVSSVLILLITALLKPKVLISDDLRKRMKNGKMYYQLKIVNLSRAILTDIDFSMYFQVKYSDGNVGAVSIPPIDKFKLIKKYQRKKNYTDYAVKINYLIDENKTVLQENTSLVFNFFAKHGISKTPIYIEKTYHLSNLKEGVFEKGKSLEITIE